MHLAQLSSRKCVPGVFPLVIDDSILMERNIRFILWQGITPRNLERFPLLQVHNLGIHLYLKYALK